MSKRAPYNKGSIPAHPATLGQRLRKIRMSWGWDQAQMAKALRTNQKTYSNWERDKHAPSQASLGSLCSYLELPLEALRDGVDFTVPNVHGYVAKHSQVAEHSMSTPPAKGRAKLVDRESGTERELTPARIRAALDKALEQGRPVYLILG